MKRLARDVALTAAGLGAIALGIAALLPVPRDRLLDAYVLVVGTLLLATLVRATREAGNASDASVYERALRRRTAPTERPPDLERIEREVVLGAANAFDVHIRLRPLLREIAEHRLESRRGLALERGAPETRALLGDDLWELVRPGRETPPDRFDAGLPLERLRAHVETLERI